MKKILLCGFSLGVLLSGTPSRAEVYEFNITEAQNNINSVTKETAQKTQDAITTAANNIIAALEDVSKQNTANMTGATNAEANMRDVQDQRMVTNEIQKEKLAAINATTSGASICNQITGAAATQHLEALAQVWGTNAVQSVLAMNQGSIPGITTPVTSAQIRTLYKTSHCTSNATAEDVALKRCSSVTQPQTQSATDSNSQRTASDDQNASLFLNQEVLSDTQSKAMERYLLLALDGHAPGQATLANVNSSGDREKTLYELDVLRALRSIPASILGSLMSQVNVIKTTGGETQTLATSWANATAGQVAGYQTGSSGSVFPDGISELAADKLKSSYWYYNLNYATYASSEGQAQAAKDLNEMVAWNTVLSYKKYRQLRDINATLAAMLSMMVDERQDKLLGNN